MLFEADLLLTRAVMEALTPVFVLRFDDLLCGYVM